MSLIQEALDRAEKLRAQQTSQAPPVFQKSKPAAKPAPQTSPAKQLAAYSKKPVLPRFWVRNLLGLALFISILISAIWLSRALRPEPAEEPSLAPAEDNSSPASKAQPTTMVLTSDSGSLFKKETSRVKYMLTGITASDGIPLAVINNQVVGVGDMLREGGVVTKIGADRVIIEVKGEKIILFF